MSNRDGADKLKPGDEVQMVNCIEADSYKDRIWKVRSNPWILGHGAEIVLLEGLSGGFSTNCLKRVAKEELV